jgi:GT2 family glycosyltransferase
MQQPQVTIIVVPRDHFSDTRESLESIFEHTNPPYKLVYVDGGSPVDIQRYLQSQALTKQFQLIRSECFLSPNHARNIGLRKVSTPYVVFIDNDVIVAPGWLQALVECAEETGAAIVSPLNCERKPLHETIHFAGGEASVKQDTGSESVQRHIVDKIYLQGQRSAEILGRLKREPTGAAEFHCMLVRTAIFEKVGLFDEKMLSTRENLDFCMMVKEAGGTIYFEPRSVITYLPPERLQWSEAPFFALRWSDAWDLSSFHHFRDKWNLVEDQYFKKQYRVLGWRRREILIRLTLLRWIPSWRVQNSLARILFPIEKLLNRFVTRRYHRSTQWQS